MIFDTGCGGMLRTGGYATSDNATGSSGSAPRVSPSLKGDITLSMVVVDCETFSELNVKKVGARVYAQHPSTRPILWAVRASDWPRALVFDDPNIWRILRGLKKAGLVKWTKNDPLDVVHWGPFDRFIASNKCLVDARERWGEMDELGVWDAPYNTRWGDLSEVSLVLGGPAKLKWAASFWSGEETKDDGVKLINRFCKPQKDGTIIGPQDDPIRWERFRSYAAQDANVTWLVLEALSEFAEEVGEDLAKHDASRRIITTINDRGVAIDVKACEKAVAAIQRIGLSIAKDVQKKYGVNLKAPAQVSNFLGTPNCQKETLEELLEEPHLDPEMRAVAEARLIVSGAATSKLDAMLARRSEDDRVRDAFIYHGAWTRRMTSTGVQLQNLVRHKVDPDFFDRLLAGKLDREDSIFQLTRDNIRGFFVSPHSFVAADYAQVELRVAAWIAYEAPLLDLLWQGADVYRHVGASILGCRPEDISGDQRQVFKAVALACQFGLSPVGHDGQGGLYARLLADGIDTNHEECRLFVGGWRASHPAIVGTWDALGAAALELARFQGPETIERRVGRVRLVRTPSCLVVERPSGFRQYLWQPQIEYGQWPDGGEKVSLVYLGRGKSGSMEWHGTYGSKLFQGVVQGTAADLMYEGLVRAENEGFPVVMSIHDEVVTEVPRATDEDVEDLCEIISELPEWAEGLPIKAEGWHGPRFTK